MLAALLRENGVAAEHFRDFVGFYWAGKEEKKKKPPGGETKVPAARF